MKILTLEDLDAQVEQWDRDQPLGLDYETNGLMPWQPGSRIVGVSLAGYIPGAERKVTGCYIPLAHRRGINADPLTLFRVVQIVGASLKPEVPDSARSVVPFYCPMEVGWTLEKVVRGLNLAGDAYIAARLLQIPQMGLKDLTEAVLSRPVVRLPEILGIGTDFSLADADDVRTADYAAADAVNGLELEAALRPRLAELGLMAIYHLEVQIAALMARETVRGYLVDPAIFTMGLIAEDRRVENLESQIYQDVGKRFLLNSNPQMTEQMNRRGITSPIRTEKGGQSWSQEALDLVAHRHPFAAKVAEWKSSHSTIASLKRSGLQAGDESLHPRWQSISVTGSARMYAEAPDVVNLPLAAQ
ncbi:MAG: hypothetical protein EHM35_11195, partial [Planctomycetaceae bacterium]